MQRNDPDREDGANEMSLVDARLYWKDCREKLPSEEQEFDPQSEEQELDPSSEEEEQDLYPMMQHLPGFSYRNYQLLLGMAIIVYGVFSLITGIGFFPYMTSHNHPPVEIGLRVGPDFARFLAVVIIILGIRYFY